MIKLSSLMWMAQVYLSGVYIVGKKVILVMDSN